VVIETGQMPPVTDQNAIYASAMPRSHFSDDIFLGMPSNDVFALGQTNEFVAPMRQAVSCRDGAEMPP
jgi:hypothetical protein